MHRPGLIATIAARGRILPVARQIEHIWIPESLLRNVFHTFTSRWTKSSRISLVAKTLRVGCHSQCCHGFHTNRPIQTSQKPDGGTGPSSNHGADSLFSWGAQLKGSLSFDYSQPSSRPPDARPNHGLLNSAKTKGEKDESFWSLVQGTEIPSKHAFPAEFTALVGLRLPVPYSNVKSPGEPWLSAPRDRLTELIQHDKLPPAKRLRSSSQRSAIIDQQVQDILGALLAPPVESGTKFRTVHLDTDALVETAAEQIPSKSLQLVPYSQQSFALVVSQIDPDLRHVDTDTEKSQFSPIDEHMPITDMLEDAQVDEPPASTIPSTVTSIDSMPPIIEPDPFKAVEILTPAENAQIIKVPVPETGEVDASAALAKPVLRYIGATSPSKRSPNLVLRHSAIIDASSDFVQTIHEGGLDLPPRPPKISLPKEERLDISSLPTLDEIQAELLEVAANKSIFMETRILIYSQIDVIYGLENLPDPKSFFESFISELGRLGWKGVRGPDLAVWLSTHRSVLRLKQKGLLSDSFLEEAVKILTTGQKDYTPKRFRNRIIDDPFRNPDFSIHGAWGMTKECLIQREKMATSKYPAPPPLATVKIFFEKIIKLLHSGAWNNTKSRAVATFLDILKYCFTYEAFRPALLFSELARFLIAWKRHWGTPEFSHDPVEGDQAGAETGSAPESESAERRPLPDIPELDELFGILPRQYADRLVCTLLLHTTAHSKGSLSQTRYLNKIMSSARLNPMTDVRKITYQDGRYLHFLNDPGLYERRIVSEGQLSVAKFLRRSQDIDIISFLLRTWPAYEGVRYINDRELLNQVQEAMRDIISRVQARISKNAMDSKPHAPGLPFAQAILSLFYLNLPTERLITSIFFNLDHSDKVQELKSCLNILSHFEGKYNGQVKFKIPKQANTIALNCFRKNHLPWALELLMHYHNRHNKTFADVILAAADKYPAQAETVFNEFLKPLQVTSIWNPQISFQKPGGWPSKWFLKNLARKYALSNHHYPTKATRRITRLRRLYKYYGHGVSMQITRALVAAAMIRTSTHRLWSGPELTAAEDLFKHERFKYAINTFVEDADKSPTYLAGLTRAEANAKKKEFIERCIKEVWEEVYRWKKYRFAVATEKRNRTKGII